MDGCDVLGDLKRCRVDQHQGADSMCRRVGRRPNGDARDGRVKAEGGGTERREKKEIDEDGTDE